MLKKAVVPTAANDGRGGSTSKSSSSSPVKKAAASGVKPREKPMPKEVKADIQKERDIETGFLIKGGPVTNERDFSQPKKISPEQLLKYERGGWLSIRNLLSEPQFLQLREEVHQYIEANRIKALRQRVRVLCPKIANPDMLSEQEVLAALEGKEVGFLQFFNLHRSSPQGSMIHKIALGKRLGGIAAQILDTDRVRVYQDCVFLKEPGFTETNWHSDLRMAPFDGNKMVTCWIPLRPVEEDPKDSGLIFAEGSHHDFALPFWHHVEKACLESRGYKVVGPIGVEQCDSTWHSGWVIHAAGPQPLGSKPRVAFSVSFIADGTRVLKKDNPSVKRGMNHNEDHESYMPWIEDIRGGGVAKHKLLPLVFGKE